jgi:hypothetical protein
MLLGSNGERILTITLDTNAANSREVETIAREFGAAVSIVTVTDRELERSDIVSFPGSRLPETAVWDESRWGIAVWASAEKADLLESVLAIISNGSFPPVGSRSGLSPGERRQLRDAMILTAHAREGRDLFVSNDQRGFIREGRRERLEKLLGTRIVTVSELRAALGALSSSS